MYDNSLSAENFKLIFYFSYQCHTYEQSIITHQNARIFNFKWQFTYNLFQYALMQFNINMHEKA